MRGIATLRRLSAEDRQGALRVRITVVGAPATGVPTTVLFFSQMPAHDADAFRLLFVI